MSEIFSGFVTFLVRLTGLSPEWVQTVIFGGIGSALIYYHTLFEKMYPLGAQPVAVNNVHNNAPAPQTEPVPVAPQTPLNPIQKFINDNGIQAREAVNNVLSFDTAKFIEMEKTITEMKSNMLALHRRLFRLEKYEELFGIIGSDEIMEKGNVIIHTPTGNVYDSKTFALLSEGNKWAGKREEDVVENPFENELIHKLKEGIRRGIFPTIEAAIRALDMRPSELEKHYTRAKLQVQLEDLDKPEPVPEIEPYPEFIEPEPVIEDPATEEESFTFEEDPEQSEQQQGLMQHLVEVPEPVTEITPVAEEEAEAFHYTEPAPEPTPEEPDDVMAFLNDVNKISQKVREHASTS